MKDQPPEDQPPVMSSMADNVSPYNSSNNAYVPPASYYPPSHTGGGHVHVVAPQPRSEPQRKRPKYTRSKTGCLTCRVKKIKCDETKPICMRCTHGQRDCTWPEGVPTRKKATPRKESVDGRPSTAESSGLSETSTPPTRDSTPPRRSHGEYSLPPVVSRRHSEPFVPPLGPDPELARRQIAPHPYHLQHSPQTNLLSMIPEMPTYQSTRYDTGYSSGASLRAPRLPGPSHQSHQSHQPHQSHQSHQSHHSHPSHQSHQSSHPLQLRSVTQQHQSQHSQHSQQAHHWTQAQMLPPLNPMESFFHTPQERNLVGHSSNDHHARYQ